MIQAYHYLPVSARSAAATLRGYYLRWWRYGPETEQLVAEALEREQWAPDRWKSWQEERLAALLHQAAAKVPYYREQWAARRRKGDSSSCEHLENWPILEKEPLRQNPAAFLADGCHPRRMYHLRTSGTTGKSLDLFWSRSTARAWYALFEARVKRWNGVSTKQPWAILGGQVVTPTSQTRPPFWVWNSALNQLYMSSYHLAPRWIPDYVEALRHYRIKYIVGYTSSLHSIAREILLSGSQRLKMSVAITNAEPIFDYQRETIGEAFQCPVRETYGMAEIVLAASECHQGHLHQWPEAGWLEVIENDQAVRNGVAGQLICTGLMNLEMPLIRYRVGDRGAAPVASAICSCGRELPVLSSVEGRIDEVLFTADGRRVGRLDPIFKGRLPIREAQIVQETISRVKVRYVPAPSFTSAAERSIKEQLQMRMGAIEVTFEQMTELPREANGKLRAVICKLPLEEQQVLDGTRL